MRYFSSSTLQPVPSNRQSMYVTASLPLPSLPYDSYQSRIHVVCREIVIRHFLWVDTSPKKALSHGSSHIPNTKKNNAEQCVSLCLLRLPPLPCDSCQNRTEWGRNCQQTIPMGGHLSKEGTQSWFQPHTTCIPHTTVHSNL